MCFYDLQKAFDSVEYLVLFEKLYDVEERGKMTPEKLVHLGIRINRRLYESIFVERGVK